MDFEYIYEGLLSNNINKRKESIETLYKMYRQTFLRKLFTNFPNIDESDAEEIYQETFIKIFQEKKIPQNVYSIYGWLQKFVINTAKNFSKSKKRSKVFYIDIEDLKIFINKFELNQKYDYRSNTPFFLKCCLDEIFNYSKTHSLNYVIYSAYIIDSIDQKQLSLLFNKDLSIIKKICTETKKDLMHNFSPCLEKV